MLARPWSEVYVIVRVSGFGFFPVFISCSVGPLYEPETKERSLDVKLVSLYFVLPCHPDLCFSTIEMESVASLDLWFETDLEGTVLRVSEDLLRVLGAMMNDIAGKNQTQILGSAWARGNEYAETQAALMKGKHQFATVKLVGKSQFLWVRCCFAPFLDSDQIKVYCEDVTQDILRTFRLCLSSGSNSQVTRGDYVRHGWDNS